MIDHRRSTFHLSRSVELIRASGTKLSRSFKLDSLVAAEDCSERLLHELSSRLFCVRSSVFSPNHQREPEISFANVVANIAETETLQLLNLEDTIETTIRAYPRPAAPQNDVSIVPRPAGPVTTRQLARYSCSTPLFPGLEDLLPFTFRGYTLLTHGMADGEDIGRVL